MSEQSNEIPDGIREGEKAPPDHKDHFFTVSGAARFFGVFPNDVRHAIKELGLVYARAVDEVGHLEGGQMVLIGRWLAAEDHLGKSRG